MSKTTPAHTSASTSHTQQVGENLKETILVHVFVDLANGLDAAHQHSVGSADTTDSSPRAASDDDLHLLYRATLILLYRLLFLLYAESRCLLPTLHSAYHPHSLTYLLKQIALNRSHLAQPAHRKPMGPHDTWIWEHLQDLFTAIERGKPAWGIPCYHGRLFSSVASDAHALLASLTDVGAVSLAPALDSLARDRVAQAATTTNDALRMIDYMNLDVRHLGAIYEALMEFQLRRTRQQPVTQGKLSLENTRQERKTSGSYYTPDSVVQHMVEMAIGPVFAERKRLFIEKMHQLRAKRNIQDNIPCLNDEIADLERETSETLLNLSILDPAMGSGNFLVSAVDYISDHIISVLEHYPTDNPIYPLLQTMREKILHDMQQLGIAASCINDEQLTNRTILRHLVIKRCVYGVDINDLAVELARLSLWLHSSTMGVPLSFLDHHLKCGNALIGTPLDPVAPASCRNPSVIQAPHMSGKAVWRRRCSIPLPTEFIRAGVLKALSKANEANETYGEFAHALAPYKAILDLWVSHYFGNTDAHALLTSFHGNIVQALDGTMPVGSQQHRDAIAQACVLAHDNRFFHWELEFPDVFVDMQHGHWKPTNEAGFDVVIGNPPWVSYAGRESKELPPETVAFYVAHYQSATGWLALHTLFGERAFHLLNANGYHAFIVPDQVGHLERYQAFRHLFLTQEEPPTYLRHVIYMGDHVFAHVVSPSMMYLVSKTAFPTVYITNKQGEKRELDSAMLVSQPGHRWVVAPQVELWARIQRISVTLDVAFGDPGVHTGNCSRQLIMPQAQAHCVPILQGSDIDMYTTPHAHVYLNMGYTPAPGDYYTIRHKNLYENTKLVIRQTARYPIATLHTGDYFRNSLLAFWGRDDTPVSAYYILALLNATLMRILYTDMVVESGQQSFPQVKVASLRQLPFRHIHFMTDADQRARLANMLIAQAEAMISASAALELLHDVAHFRASTLGQAIVAMLPTCASVESDVPGQFLAFQTGATGTEEHSDVVHDLLVYLAQRMLDLNKQRQAEMQHYLSNLEMRLNIAYKGKVGIDALAGKTTIQNYLGDYQKGEDEQPWQAILAVLSRNKRRFGVGKEVLQHPLCLEQLHAEYETSLVTLRPIKAQLARTYTLIDQVVYLLYGLTEEEVRIGAERFKPNAKKWYNQPA